MLAGGGSGGHTYPLVAVAQELLRLEKQAGKTVQLCFIGDGDLLAQAARDMNTPFKRVLAPKWRRYASIKNFLDILKIPLAFIQAFVHVWLYMPDVMLVKGGYASFFPAIIAKLLTVPIIVHESDSIPGKVNHFWGKHSKRVFLSFESASQYFPKGRTEVIGCPIRDELLALPDSEKARQEFGFGIDKPTIFVSGGSLGAKEINDVVLEGIVEITKKYYVIHQCGADNYEEVSKYVSALQEEEKKSLGSLIQTSYKLFGHMNVSQLANAYAAADIIIARSGSSSFEIAAAGKPVILIPLKSSANDHQLANAREFAKYGAIVMEQDNVTPHLLLYEIDRANTDWINLSRQIMQFARPQAAAIIAKELLDAAS